MVGEALRRADPLGRGRPGVGAGRQREVGSGRTNGRGPAAGVLAAAGPGGLVCRKWTVRGSRGGAAGGARRGAAVERAHGCGGGIGGDIQLDQGMPARPDRANRRRSCSRRTQAAPRARAGGELTGVEAESNPPRTRCASPTRGPAPDPAGTAYAGTARSAPSGRTRAGHVRTGRPRPDPADSGRDQTAVQPRIAGLISQRPPPAGAGGSHALAVRSGFWNRVSYVERGRADLKGVHDHRAASPGATVGGAARRNPRGQEHP